MISRIIFNENITVAFCSSASSAQLSSAQLSSNINLFKIFALLFNAFNKLCHCEPNKVKAWQSTFNKALNSVKSNLLFVDCFGLRPRNDGERDCLAFSMPRNDKHIYKFEIISHNKNLKSIYYGFLFNKQNFIVRGGIGQ